MTKYRDRDIRFLKKVLVNLNENSFFKALRTLFSQGEDPWDIILRLMSNMENIWRLYEDDKSMA